MLKLTQKNNTKFLLACSSEIYGDHKQHPQKEDYFGNVNPIGKRNYYEEGKRISESLCNDFARLSSLEIRIVRILNTYGQRLSKIMVELSQIS